MQPIPAAQAGTALSPEWDRGFDEAFAELISGDADLVRAEFDALIGAVWSDPPAPPSPPAPCHPRPPATPDGTAGPGRQPASGGEHHPITDNSHQRSPP